MGIYGSRSVFVSWSSSIERWCDMATYDLAVIGAGTGGLVTAAGAAQFGAKVALIERDKLGGECLYTGCVPSKALIHCAKVASLVRRAGTFGIDVPTPSIDFPRVMAYVRQVIETIGQHDSPERFQRLGIDVIHGKASFVDTATLQVGEQQLTSKQFVIATGSRSTIPPIEGLPEAGYLTHVEALNLAHQPGSLVILGAGPIGIELAQLFARLGTVVQLEEGQRMRAMMKILLVSVLLVLIGLGLVFRDQIRVEALLACTGLYLLPVGMKTLMGRQRYALSPVQEVQR